MSSRSESSPMTAAAGKTSTCDIKLSLIEALPENVSLQPLSLVHVV